MTCLTYMEMMTMTTNEEVDFDKLPDESEILAEVKPKVAEEAQAILNEMNGKIPYVLAPNPTHTMTIEMNADSLDKLARLVMVEMIAPLPMGPNGKTFHIDSNTFEVYETTIRLLGDHPGDNLQTTYHATLKGNWR